MKEQGFPISTGRIRWGRIVVAAVLSEVGVVAALLATIGVYRFVIAPGQAAAVYDAFGDRAAYVVAPAAAGIATFLGALWVCRKVSARFAAHGMLAGTAAVLLSIGFVFTAPPEARFMYGVSFVLRIAGGYLGGMAAQRRSGSQPAPALSRA